MSRDLCVGMLRIKNESRWIEEVLSSILPVCSRIFVMDDHSTDDTFPIISRMADSDPRLVPFRSPFYTLDESRDKNFMYDTILECAEYLPDASGYRWPEWLLCTDGDEVLDSRDIDLLRSLMTDHPDVVAWKLRILYLWNDRQTRRTDGVYERFARPSLFRVFNPSFRFQSTPWGNGANFHCSSIPQELLYQAQWSEVRLKHLGYMEREDRLRKYEWYNQIDPKNPAEDEYRHIVQGDVPEVPAEQVRMHAGPLRLEPVE